MFILPGKGRVLSFFLKGWNLTQYVHCMRVYESVCKAYITAQVIIYDNNNLIESMAIVAGDQAILAFDAPPNQRPYAVELSVLKMKGEQVPDTLKYQIYYIDFIGEAYFKDRANTVREVFTNTGTAAIRKIWTEYIGTDNLVVQNESAGPLGKPPASYSSASEKPLTAIHRIMQTMVSAQFPTTGSWLFFRDRDAVQLAQLEGLIENVQKGGRGQEYFIQKETWGINFNDRDLYHAVIVAQMEAGRGDGGRGSGADIAAAASQTLAKFDLGTGMITGKGINPLAGVFAGQLQSVASNFLGSVVKFGGGGLPNIMAYNTARSDEGTAPPTKTTGENSYSAEVRNGPQLTLKVPIQTGLNVTVGKGIWVELMPPTGDFAGNPYAYLLRGPWLVCDICHELYTDGRELQGSSSMQCVRGSLT